MSRDGNETRVELIEPALRVCEWTEDSIRREETARAVDTIGEGMVKTGKR